MDRGGELPCQQLFVLASQPGVRLGDGIEKKTGIGVEGMLV